MNLKKTVIISLAALACAGFIAGCGSDKKDAVSYTHLELVPQIEVLTSEYMVTRDGGPTIEDWMEDPDLPLSLIHI